YGVAADEMYAQARGEFIGPVVELQAAAEQPPHHRAYVIALKDLAYRGVTHMPAGHIGHLEILEMKGRAWEQVMIPAVVVVHVRDDDIADVPRFDTDHGQTLARATQHLATSFLADGSIEASVDDVGLVRPDDRPDEVVDRHRPVMRIAAEEVFGSHAFVMLGVPHGIDFIRHERGHRLLPRRR